MTLFVVCLLCCYFFPPFSDPQIFLATEYPSHGSDSWQESDRLAKKPVYDDLVSQLAQSLTVVEGYSGDLKDAGAVAIADRILCEGSLSCFTVLHSYVQKTKLKSKQGAYALHCIHA